MGDILTDLSPSTVVAAIEDNLFQCFRQLFSHTASSPRIEFHDDPAMMWSLTDIRFPLFNAILRARLAEPGIDDAIEAAVARCRERDVPLLWWTGPATRPADLGARLEAQGLIPIGDSPGMAADLHRLSPQPTAPTGVTAQRVEDRETLRTWCRVIGVGDPLSSAIPIRIRAATVEAFTSPVE